MFRPVLILAMTLAALAAPVNAQGLFGQPEDEASNPARMSALVDVAAIRPDATFHVVVVFRIEPHWHLYWKNPGATGMPTEIKLTMPPGFTAAPPLFPRPASFVEPEGVTYGYEKDVAIFVPVTAPATHDGGDVGFGVEASWLVCNKVCLLGAETLRTPPVPFVTDGAAVAAADPGPLADIVRRHRARLPRKLEPKSGITLAYDGERLTITGPASPGGDAQLFPLDAPGVFFDAPRSRRDGGRFIIEVNVDVRGDAGPAPVLRGLVAPDPDADAPAWSFALPIEAPP